MKLLLNLKQHLYTTKLWNRFAKNSRELCFWADSIERMIKWYTGAQPYHFPFPRDEEKEKRFDLKKNAVMTYFAMETKFARYASSLCLNVNSLRGKRVADIGSGPTPTLLVFSDCERYCVDHLIDKYRAIGYPLDEYESEIHFVNAKAERIPCQDNLFDVIISRNALDHVDSFERAAIEIRRLLRPEGAVHLLINYHDPKGTEPVALNDERVMKSLGDLNLRKIYEAENAWGFNQGKTVLWSTLAPECLTEYHLFLPHDELTKIVETAVKRLCRNHPVRQVYLFGPFCHLKPGEYSEINLAVVLESDGNSRESALAEHDEIIREAQGYDSILEVACFRESEFDRGEGAILKQVKNEGVRLL